MNLPTVTFETKCYEKDWEILLKTGRLAAMIERNCFEFAERILYINNVNDPDKVRRYAERLKEQGVISEYVLVEEHADEALAFFGLDRDSFKGGYYYSIQELVGIYLCRTDYLLHFSGDSILDGSFPWIEQGAEILNRDQRVRSVNCVWNRKLDEARDNALEEHDDFWIGYGFSDQCYLIRTADFRARIYGETHPASERFPTYGGELFEKRVDAWTRHNGYLRATYVHGSYLSNNFSRYWFVRTAGRLLGLYDRERTTSIRDLPQPETILICSIRVIGDVILTTPLIGILKDAYPNAAIDLIVAADTGSFLRQDPRVRKIIEMPSKNEGDKRSPREDISVLGKIFKKYDLAINMNASDRGNLAVVCAGRNVRIGFYENKGVVKDGWKKLLLSHPLPYDTAGHTAHLCKLVAEALGFDVSRLEVKLYWNDGDAQFVRSRLEALPNGKGYFVIHPFARWEYKYWPMESFVRLSDDIARNFGLIPVWTAAPTASECELLDQYASQCRYQPISIRGAFSLNQMACLIAGSQLYLGLDTAISHIAASTGVPMVALYGPTAMNRWFPWNNSAAADQFYDCSRGTFRNGHIVAIQQECDHPGCVHERCTSPCIPRISPEEVFAQAAQLLVENGHVRCVEMKVNEDV